MGQFWSVDEDEDGNKVKSAGMNGGDDDGDDNDDDDDGKVNLLGS